jgi:PelA/Pel-15E family pectate lyase
MEAKLNMDKHTFIPLYLIVLMTATWATAEKRISRDTAETLLLYQRANGGWPKNFAWDDEVNDQKKRELHRRKQENDTTIDNGGTYREIQYLARAYDGLKDERYKQAALKGMQFLLEGQYDNGGWPQYYPRTKGYSRHITFNDNAMIGVMSLLRDIVEGKPEYSFVDKQIRQRAAKAIERGVDCILNCQITVNGKKTAWCAQHDEKTLEACKARSYELASLSGAESVKIVRFLMAIEEPSSEMVEAIEAAVAWFDQVKIQGKRVQRIQDSAKPGGRDRIVVQDASAPPLWGRFYEIQTMRPFFCSRDGIPKYHLSEISHERRNGYSWLGSYARDLLAKDYPAWRNKMGR